MASGWEAPRQPALDSPARWESMRGTDGGGVTEKHGFFFFGGKIGVYEAIVNGVELDLCCFGDIYI